MMPFMDLFHVPDFTCALPIYFNISADLSSCPGCQRAKSETFCLSSEGRSLSAMMLRVLILVYLLVGVYAAAKLDVNKVVASLLLKVFGIKDVDVSTCVSNVEGTSTSLKSFSAEVKVRDYKTAMLSLGKAISLVSSSVANCGVQEVNLKLDSLAIALKYPKITSGVDKAVRIVIGAGRVEKDVAALAAAVSAGNSDGVANSIGNLLKDWNSVAGGCKAGSKVCPFVNGLLRLFQQSAIDIKPCEIALVSVISQFEAGAGKFSAKNYQAAVTTWAAALDATALVLKQDQCGLGALGTLVGNLSPKLAAAVVTIESSGAVKIAVGSADVYDALFRSVLAIKKKDWSTFGFECGELLRLLRTSGCQTKACDILEGTLASLQLELTSIDGCLQSVDAIWSDVENSITLFHNKQPVDGVKSLGTLLVALANSVQSCNVPQLATIAETMITKMGNSPAAVEIGNVVTLLVNGADLTLEVEQSVVDFDSRNYNAFGSDLTTLAQSIGSSRCRSVGCQVVEGILGAAGTAFSDLRACKQDIQKSEIGFVTAAQQFKLKEYKLAVQSVSASLSSVAAAVTACGLQKQMGFIVNEANVLGLANVTALSTISNDIAILVHGADFYQLLYAMVQDAQKHNWRAAGGDLQRAMTQLSTWTKAHACTDNFCFVVIGILQYLGDIQGSIKECKQDFKMAYGDFIMAYKNMTLSHSAPGFWGWKANDDSIRKGIAALGEGIEMVSQGVGACDLVEFADILAELAAKLGIAPEVSWIEEGLHLLINGVRIEQEVGSAMVDWSNRNWPGFGYNIAALVKTLV